MTTETNDAYGIHVSAAAAAILAGEDVRGRTVFVRESDDLPRQIEIVNRRHGLRPEDWFRSTVRRADGRDVLVQKVYIFHDTQRHDISDILGTTSAPADGIAVGVA